MSSHVFTSLRPNAGALQNLYSVPTGMRFTGRVIVANCGDVTLVKVTVAPEGEADQEVHAILHDAPLTANVSISTAPIMISETDVIRVLSLSGEVNFHITGLLQDL